MRYPKYLPKKGTIGFVAPSLGAFIEPYHTLFDHALEKFKSMGYQVQLGPNVYEGSGLGISNTPAKCGRELTEYYCSPQNDILISCGGGELMCEILDYVDFQRIKEAPAKWFMGYSDNTNFSFLSATICDTASVYGPCASTFGSEPWHSSLQDAMNLLTGEETSVHGYDLWESIKIKNPDTPLAPYHVTEPNIMKAFQWDGEEFSGRLIGGCMDCLGVLLGTCYDHVTDFNQRYQEDGIIWFLEACDLNVMSIRRTMWQMKHAGWFQNVKGFLIGRPLHFGEDMMGLDQYHAVLDIIGDLGVPVLMDLDIGHLPPMMPLINGSYATVKPYQENIQITFEKK